MLAQAQDLTSPAPGFYISRLLRRHRRWQMLKPADGANRWRILFNHTLFTTVAGDMSVAADWLRLCMRRQSALDCGGTANPRRFSPGKRTHTRTLVLRCRVCVVVVSPISAYQVGPASPDRATV